MTPAATPLLPASDSSVGRLRWIMAATMLADAVATIASQASAYWRQPAVAFYGNSFFLPLLRRGPAVYAFAQAAYLAGAWLLVLWLPRRAALVAIFFLTVIHYFDAAHWLDYHWGWGMPATFICALSLAIALLGLEFDRRGKEAVRILVRRLRWLMAAAMGFDSLNTLLGQPAAYWRHPGNLNEGFGPSHAMLALGPSVAIGYMVAGAMAEFWLVSILPSRLGLLAVFFLLLSNYFGASTWLEGRWGLGIGGAAGYGLILALVLVRLAFFGGEASAGNARPLPAPA